MATSTSAPKFDGQQLYVEKTYGVTALECRACGLRLKTLGDWIAAEVDPRIIVAETTGLHELHDDDEYDEYDNM